MGWIRKQPCNHVPWDQLWQDQPWPGDTWECDECGQHWLMQNDRTFIPLK